MDRMIVAVFDDESQAARASRALAELNADGTIAVYGAAVIHKDAEGQVTVLDAGDEGPIGTVSGTLVGSLIGVLAGPAGLVVGATMGALGGMWYDIYNSGIGMQFVDDVGSVLVPGKFAVVAEIMEEWTAPVDSRMEELGGIVFRRARIDVEDSQYDREIAAANAELDQLEAELNQAAGDAKEKLRVKVEAAREKLDAAQENAKAKLDELKQEADAKVAVIQESINKAHGDAKKKLEKKSKEIKKDYDRRIDHLKKAWESIKAALT